MIAFLAICEDDIEAQIGRWINLLNCFCFSYLQLTIKDDVIKSQDTCSVIESIAGNHKGRKLALKFVKEHWKLLFDRWLTHCWFPCWSTECPVPYMNVFCSISLWGLAGSWGFSLILQRNPYAGHYLLRLLLELIGHFLNYILSRRMKFEINSKCGIFEPF